MEDQFDALSEIIRKHCTMPKNDKRSFPDAAASAPFDWDGIHWNEGDPDSPGWYAVALFDEDDCGYSSYIRLPVERAYYEGDGKWSRRKGKRNSLMHEKYYLDDGEGCCLSYRYYVEYWCKIPESGKLPQCYFNW